MKREHFAHCVAAWMIFFHVVGFRVPNSKLMRFGSRSKLDDEQNSKYTLYENDFELVFY